MLLESSLGTVLSAACGRGRRMDRARWITHQGKQILFLDLTNCTAQEVIQSVNEVQHIVTTQPINSVRTLSDLNGAHFSRDAVTRIKEVQSSTALT